KYLVATKPTNLPSTIALLASSTDDASPQAKIPGMLVSLSLLKTGTTPPSSLTYFISHSIIDNNEVIGVRPTAIQRASTSNISSLPAIISHLSFNFTVST